MSCGCICSTYVCMHFPLRSLKTLLRCLPALLRTLQLSLRITGRSNGHGPPFPPLQAVQHPAHPLSAAGTHSVHFAHAQVPDGRGKQQGAAGGGSGRAGGGGGSGAAAVYLVPLQQGPGSGKRQRLGAAWDDDDVAGGDGMAIDSLGPSLSLSADCAEGEPGPSSQSQPGSAGVGSGVEFVHADGTLLFGGCVVQGDALAYKAVEKERRAPSSMGAKGPAKPKKSVACEVVFSPPGAPPPPAPRFTCAACNAAFMELEAMTAAQRAHRVDLAGDGPAQAAVDASVEQLNTIFTSLQQYVGHVMRSCIQQSAIDVAFSRVANDIDAVLIVADWKVGRCMLYTSVYTNSHATDRMGTQGVLCCYCRLHSLHIAAVVLTLRR